MVFMRRVGARTKDNLNKLTPSEAYSKEYQTLEKAP